MRVAHRTYDRDAKRFTAILTDGDNRIQIDAVGHAAFMLNRVIAVAHDLAIDGGDTAVTLRKVSTWDGSPEPQGDDFRDHLRKV